MCRSPIDDSKFSTSTDYLFGFFDISIFLTPLFRACYIVINVAIDSHFDT